MSSFSKNQLLIQVYKTVNLKKDKDLMWTIEEALKCDALSALVGKVRELNLPESRRIQLAVEESKMTGLLHRTAHAYRDCFGNKQ